MFLEQHNFLNLDGGMMKKATLLLLTVLLSTTLYAGEKDNLISAIKSFVPAVENFKAVECSGKTAARYLTAHHELDGVSLEIAAYSTSGNERANFYLHSKYLPYFQVIHYKLRENSLLIYVENNNQDTSTRAAESDSYTLSISREGELTRVKIVNDNGLFGKKSVQECLYNFN